MGTLTDLAPLTGSARFSSVDPRPLILAILTQPKDYLPPLCPCPKSRDPDDLEISTLSKCGHMAAFPQNTDLKIPCKHIQCPCSSPHHTSACDISVRATTTHNSKHAAAPRVRDNFPSSLLALLISSTGTIISIASTITSITSTITGIESSVTCPRQLP